MSMPAASRCSTSRPGLSDQIRRANSFRFLPVSRVALPGWLALLLFMLSSPPFPIYLARRGPVAMQFTLSPTGSCRLFEAAATNLTIARTRAILVYGQKTRQCIVGHSLPCLLSPFSLSFWLSRRAQQRQLLVSMLVLNFYQHPKQASRRVSTP